MATQLFLRDTASDLAGAGQKLLSTARGALAVNRVTNTVGGGNDLQVTDAAGGQVLEWLTGQLNPVTIFGNITVNIRGLESATAANAAAGIRIERASSAGAVLATIVPITSIPATANEYTTVDTAKSATVTPTSTTLVGGDRLRVTLFVRAASGVTMGGGRSVTNTVDGPTGGAAGDSFVTFAENLTAFAGATAFPAGIGAVAAIGAAVASAGVVAAPTVLACAAQIPTPPRVLAQWVKHVGDNVKAGSSNSTTLTLAAGVNVPAGARLVVGWGGSLNIATNALACSDSKANTYSLYAKQSASNADITVAVFSAPLVTALVPGDTITVVQGGNATTHGWVLAEEWSNLTVPAVVSTGTDTTAAPASGQVTQAGGAAYIGMLATYSTGGTVTGSAAAPWNQRDTQAITTSTFRWFGLWDQVQASGATLDFQPTIGSSTKWAAALVALTSGTEPPTATLAYSWAGAVTTSSVVVVAQTNLATSVRLVVSLEQALGSPVFGAAQTPDAQGYSRHPIGGLAAGTRYYYGVELDGVVQGAQGTFVTAPSGAASFSVATGSCAETSASTGWGRALARTPTLGLILGDFPYADVSSNDQQAVRDAREALLTRPEVNEFVRKTATAYTWSDHDFGSNNANSTSLSKPAVQAVYRQQVPHHPLEVGDGIYHAFVYGRCRFILTDNRSYKSLQTDTDNASKTVLGSVQKQWFKDQISNATERVIFWANENPWVGAAVVGDDEWSGYSTERTELGNHIAASGKVVIVVSGDMHAVAYHNGSGVAGRTPVFHAAAWNAAFSNKGGPYTQGPYPTSGGIVNQYGLIDVTDPGGSLTVRFRGFDTADTVRVDATLAFGTPQPIAAVAGIGAPTFPTGAVAQPSRVAGVVAIPTPDTFGDPGTPNATPETIAAVARMGEDLEPPTVPAGLHATSIAATSADLAWNPSTDNVAVARYAVIVRETPRPAGPAGAWQLVFEDQFEGTTLDTTKWAAPVGWNTNNTLSNPANISVAGGMVTLQLSTNAQSEVEGCQMFTDPGEIGNPGSTFLFPVEAFAEARVYFPGSGADHIYNWGGWWTSGAAPVVWAIAGEHDIAEGVGGDLAVNYWRNVPPGAGGTPTPLGHIYPAGSWQNGWHTFGLHRKTSSSDVYWDGVLVRSYATNDSGDPHVLILSIGKGDPDRPPVLGAAGAMKVAYVRAWLPL